MKESLMQVFDNKRLDLRENNQLRNVKFEVGCTMHAEGACMVEFGNTKVLCTATVDERVPPFLRNTGQGWVTAEYSMLPRSTSTRIQREAAKGKLGGRTQEIQRLIGRALRAAVDLEALGERQIIIDCDVIQADGGTRTAAISGGFVALYEALQNMQARKVLKQIPIKFFMAAVSCGIVDDRLLLDLAYNEDSMAEVDANFVINEHSGIIEVQGSAEGSPFSNKQFLGMLELAEQGIKEIITLQTQALKKP